MAVSFKAIIYYDRIVHEADSLVMLSFKAIIYYDRILHKADSLVMLSSGATRVVINVGGW